MYAIVNTEYTNHYPVVVMQRQYSGVDQLNAELANLVLSMEKKYIDTPANASHDSAIATEGGYQTATELNLFKLSNASIQQLHDKLLKPAIAEYLHKVFGEQGQLIRFKPYGWSNVLRSGDWQRPHMHASTRNIVSGVYYVTTPAENSPHGNIDFINPLPVSLHHGYSPCLRIQPEAGLLLLFPPYHMHYVHPVKSSEPRIVIAFDVLASE